MSDLVLRPATAEDCAELALTLREADRQEIALGGSPSPYDSLMRGVAYSDEPLAIVTPSGEIAAIGGVVRLAPGLASPWMLGSDALGDLKWPFLRQCKARLAELHGQYPTLFNEVWEGNTAHIRWLKWLGFTVGDAPLLRPNFLPFWKNHV